MVRKFVIKKNRVVSQDLKINGHGCYCFLLYDNVDEKGKFVAKVGMTTTSFAQRVEQYHTYVPLGVFLLCFLQGSSRERSRGMSQTTYWLKVEDALFDELQRNGVDLIYTTTRVAKEGRSEFVYCDEKQMFGAFNTVKERFGGQLHLFNTSDVNKYNKREKPKSLYVGETIYPLAKIQKL